jgi:hypothetical protein
MTREHVIEAYMINSKECIAGMLYDTITRYETKICKNCVYCNTRGDSFGKCTLGSSPTTNQTVSYYYGCNRFKAKDK